MAYHIRLLFWALVIVGGFALQGPGGVSAGTLTVNSTASSGPMTLRHAIESANGNPGHDVINFDPTVFPPGSPATIIVLDELPEIRGDLTIDGSGAGVIISGDMLTGDEAGLDVSRPTQAITSVTLRDLIIRDFPGDGIRICGGGLPGCESNVSVIELDGITSTQNGGNGITIQGGTISDVRFQDCSATMNAADGVLVESVTDASDVQLAGCVVDSNDDWGLFVSSGGNIVDFGLTDSSVSSNDGIGAYLDSVEQTIRPLIDNVEATGNRQMGIGFSSAQPLRDLTFVDSTVDGNGSTNANGLGTEVLALQIIDATITGNSFSNNMASNAAGGVGFQIYSQVDRPSGMTITDNVFNGNVGPGISIITDTPGHPPVAVSLIAHNEVSGNTGDGVSIYESGPITISQNRIFDNQGIGINLKGGETEEDQSGVTPNDPGDGDEGSNELLNFPVLAGASGNAVQGTACAGCTVELFESDPDPTGYGEGRMFIAEATAVGGSFSIPVSGLCAGDQVTATATDSDGNTSEFSANLTVTADTPGCGPALVWGDHNCSQTVDPVDSLLTLRHDAGLGAETGECPEFGTAIPAGGPALVWGDVDCNGTIDPVDALKLLRFDAGLSVQQEEGCPEIGGPVS